MRFRALRRCALLIAAGAGIAAAQTVPFQIFLTGPNFSGTVANDSTIPFNAEIGQSITYQAKATYIGNGEVMLSSSGLQLLGSSEFTAALAAMQPTTLFPGNSISFSMTFKSTSANQAGATLTIPYSETTASGSTSNTTQSAIVLILAGTSPSYQFSYILTSNENVVPLQSGGTIPFPPTQINTSPTALLNISNGGSGYGTITAITQPTDPAFKVSGLPLFPYTLVSDSTLQLQITYTPTAASADADQIQITLGSGTVFTFMLTGSGINAAYTYQLIQNGTPAPVTPPGPIALPDTNVGSTNSVIIQVQNTGNATGIINSPPAVAGAANAGFSVSDLPLFPQTLKAGGSFTFTLNFAPTQPGAQKGTLVIGSDLFNLTGNGLGPNLTYSYTSAAGTITLPTSNPTVVFSPVAVSQSEQVTFLVMNAGTTSTTLSNIGITQAASPFSVSGLPSLPVTIAAGKSIQFTINFAPTTTGFSSGALQLDTTAIALTGSGTPPPPLPSYTIQGPSGAVAPATQPSVGLTLASAYPVDLTGTLTLSTSGTLVTDPAVQFSSGGRTAPFTIPANTTAANFGGLGSQIFIQTGTVASSITLTPTFATEAGDINVTPTNPTTLQFSVPAAAPALIAVTVGNVTSNSFTLQVAGYSTTRTLTTLNVTFTPASGFNLTGSQVSVDVSQAATVWFDSTASESFGGQFTVTVPFTLQGKLPVNETLVEAISAISATISNEIGASNSLQATLQ